MNLDETSNLLSQKIENLSVEIERIKSRNLQKDLGKEFETSWTRVILIMIITYLTLFGYMSYIGVQQPALSAIVPTTGFNISTWSLSYLKVLWVKLKMNQQPMISILRQIGSKDNASTSDMILSDYNNV